MPNNTTDPNANFGDLLNRITDLENQLSRPEHSPYAGNAAGYATVQLKASKDTMTPPPDEHESQRANNYPEIESIIKTLLELTRATTEEVYRLRTILANERQERYNEQEHTIKALDTIRATAQQVFEPGPAKMNPTPGRY